MKTKKRSFKIEDIVKNVFLVLTIVSFGFAIKYSFDNIYLPGNVNVILALPFIFFMTPYLSMSLFALKKIESKMEVVPRFLRDVVDNVESGMDLVSSIKACSLNEYGVLNEDVRKFANQLSWGVDFSEAMVNFSDNVGSRPLKRDFLLVIEARRVGGHVDKILRELSQKITIENLRNKERRSNLSSNTFTGYISFMIFLLIIVLIYNSLFVGISASIAQAQASGGGSSGSLVSSDDTKMDIYLSLFILLAYELAILSGFLFGLMQENNVISGAPHVVALVVITFIAFFFFV